MIDVVFIVIFAVVSLIILASVGWTLWKNRSTITVPSFLTRCWGNLTSCFKRRNTIRDRYVKQIGNILMTIIFSVIESHQILEDEDEGEELNEQDLESSNNNGTNNENNNNQSTATPNN